MIPILNQIVNWFTRNFRAVAVGLVSLLIATVFVQNHQLQKKNKEKYLDISLDKELPDDSNTELDS